MIGTIETAKQDTAQGIQIPAEFAYRKGATLYTMIIVRNGGLRTRRIVEQKFGCSAACTDYVRNARMQMTTSYKMFSQQ